MSIKRLSLLTIIITLNAALAGELAVPRKIIDSPTAGNLKRGAYHLDFRVYPNGGLLAEVVVGLFSNLYLGIAYGGSNIIGSGMIEHNDRPGLMAQFRVLDENIILPALALGYNNQALGPYSLGNDQTYFVQSKGLYLVASKNYHIIGNLGLHAGLNYRIEKKDKVPDLYFLTNFEINKEISICAEYDAAINNDLIEFGHLNLGVAFLFGSRIQLEVDFKNILEIKRFVDANRELRIVYIDHF